MKMSQKKGKYLLGLLVGVVSLGIGYAAITNVTLNINGSATAVGSQSDADFVVRFVKSTDTTSEVSAVNAVANNAVTYTVVTGDEIEASASITNDTTATFNVENMIAGDEVKFTYYIANLSDGLGAEITPTITNEFSDNFVVTVNPSSVFDLSENNVQEINVTVRCIAQNKVEKSGTFNVSFTAIPTE